MIECALFQPLTAHTHAFYPLIICGRMCSDSITSWYTASGCMFAAKTLVHILEWLPPCTLHSLVSFQDLSCSVYDIACSIWAGVGLGLGWKLYAVYLSLRSICNLNQAVLGGDQGIRMSSGWQDPQIKYFSCGNYNKREVCVDLRDDKGVNLSSGARSNDQRWLANVILDSDQKWFL